MEQITKNEQPHNTNIKNTQTKHTHRHCILSFNFHNKKHMYNETNSEKVNKQFKKKKTTKTNEQPHKNTHIQKTTITEPILNN